MCAVSLALFVAANALSVRRDLDQGVLPSRPGRPRASRFLQSPIGLAFRLQRAGMIGWAIGLFALGASYGSILGELETFFGSNDMLGRMLDAAGGGSITEQFIALLMTIIALVATIPPVLTVNRLRGEEKRGRVEPLLGRAVSRARLLGGYVIIAALNGFVMIAASVTGLWAAGNASVENGLNFGKLLGDAMAYYPAVLVMVGLAAFLVGFFPRLTALNWLYLFYAYVVLYMGGMLQAPEWSKRLTPHGLVPSPADDAAWLPLAALCAAAVRLTAAGLAGYRRRDIASS